MEKFLLSFASALLAVLAIFFVITLGTLCGAFAGWVVGLFFGETILGMLDQLNVHSVSMWQFGAFMGFVGGFVRSTQTNKA